MLMLQKTDATAGVVSKPNFQTKPSATPETELPTHPEDRFPPLFVLTQFDRRTMGVVRFRALPEGKMAQFVRLLSDHRSCHFTHSRVKFAHPSPI